MRTTVKIYTRVAYKHVMVKYRRKATDEILNQEAGHFCQQHVQLSEKWQTIFTNVSLA